MRSYEGLHYLRMYPHLWKWMNRYPGCGFVGYKPELPEFDYSNGLGLAPRNLRAMFPCLPLGDDGFCDQCHRSSEFKSAVNPPAANPDAPSESD
jgi:hypothetical protein